MPCYKCSNGKWKYGEHGNCQFATKKACRRAEQAIHARKPKKELGSKSSDCNCGCTDCQNKNKKTT